MSRLRRAFVVYVDMEPGDTDESAREGLEWILNQHISHYDPQVAHAPDSLQPVDKPAHETKPPVTPRIIVAKREAKLIVETLQDDAITHAVSVAHVNARIGMMSRPIDLQWGWTNLDALTYREVDEGYLLVFPPLEHLFTKNEGTN